MILALALALAVAGEVWCYVASCFAEIAEGFFEVDPVGVFVVFQCFCGAQWWWGWREVTVCGEGDSGFGIEVGLC